MHVFIKNELYDVEEHRCSRRIGSVIGILTSWLILDQPCCRAFKKYALCMEPRLQRCDPSMTYRYLRNKDAYTQPPYSCTAPSVVRRTAHTQTVIDSRSTATLCLPLWMTFSVRLLTSSTLITAITNYVSYYILLGTVL